MLIIRENRLLAAVIGGLLAMVLLVVVLTSGGGSSDTPPAAVDDGTASPAAEGTSSVLDRLLGGGDPDRPAVARFGCFEIMTEASSDAALGVDDRPFEEQGVSGRGEGQACGRRLGVDGRFFIELSPGDPADFLEGTLLMGTTGEPVDGVGGIARWFGGEDSETAGLGGLLSVAQATPLGVVSFRVLLGRPDLENEEQIEVAREFALTVLPRFPGVETPEPEPTATPEPVVVEPPAVGDTSAFGYVENLLEKEADGEWTRGEGLVATLAMLAGEAEPEEVLRHAEIQDVGTEVIELAEEWLLAEPDAPEAEEVGRLLDGLIWAATPDEEQATSHGAEASPRRSASQAITQIQEGDDGLLCETRSCDPPSCHWGLWFDTPGVCTFRSVALEYSDGLPATQIFGPQVPVDGYSWRTRHLSAATATVRAANDEFIRLGIDFGRADVYLSNAADLGHTAVKDGVCGVYLGETWARQDTSGPGAEFPKQVLAYLLAECAITNGGSFAENTMAHPWKPGAAMYLSDLVAPNGNYELGKGLVTELHGVELARGLESQAATIWGLFEHLRGPAASPVAVALLKTQRAELVDFPDMDGHLDRYARELTDGTIRDHATDHSYGAPVTDSLGLDGPLFRRYPLGFYSTVRLAMSVPSGKHACISFDGLAGATTSWSGGAPGATGDWSHEIPKTLSNDATFVFTTTGSESVVVFSVSDVVDDPDDCDPEDEDEPPGPTGALDCQDCGYSDYHTNFDDWKEVEQFEYEEYLS